MARSLPTTARSEFDGRFEPSHGMSRLPEYQAWANAIYRCENSSSPHWSDYGKRGIKVCDVWRTNFDKFFDDMGPRPSPMHSLDRIDVNKGYQPGNCRWSTAVEQANNRRNTPRILGLSPREISERTGLPINTIKNRLRRGWSPERIISEPRRNYPESIAC
jgi:hypothetical protein